MQLPTNTPRGFRDPLAGDARAEGPLALFLRQVRPRVEELLGRYRVPEAAAAAMLHETLQVLVWKWETVRNREAWLTAVLERKCRTFASQSLEPHADE
jgi:hypothetical protein